MPPVDGTVPPMDGTMPPMDDSMMDASDDNVNSFGKKKFDAGIDVDEDADPKKYIEKLTGKLAQKLRDYNESENDVDLNKFVINSLIPASVPEMDDVDAKDVIKKVKDNIGASKTETPSNNEVDSDEDVNNLSPDIQNVDGGNNQDEIPPVQQEGVNVNEIDDLVNELLGKKKLKKNSKTNTPFKSPTFK